MANVWNGTTRIDNGTLHLAVINISPEVKFLLPSSFVFALPYWVQGWVWIFLMLTDPGRIALVSDTGPLISSGNHTSEKVPRLTYKFAHAF